jgi:hypothetical protein
MLNRGVLIVRPAQPFIDWAAGLDDSGIVPNPNDEQTVYLVPSFEDDDEAEQILKVIFAEVFARELFGWHTDESAWPRRRTLSLFKKWFRIELHSVVEDLCGYEFLDDEV